MNFQLEKKLNYDPKHVISQRKTSARLGTYEHQEDQALAIMANHSYIEQDDNMSNNDQEMTMVHKNKKWLIQSQM